MATPAAIEDAQLGTWMSAAAPGRPGIPAADAVAELTVDVGLPARPEALGISLQNSVPLQRLLHDRFARINIRPLTSTAEVIEILEMAK